MDISESIFQAVDILIDKKIESVKFDETIEATIENAEQASEGLYVVSSGAAKFVAYGYNTQYKEKDVVLVTIPQGNYDNQKIIIGKKVADTQQSMIYQSPFQSFINISNNLINTNILLEPMCANSGDSSYTWPITNSNFSVDNCIWHGNYLNTPLHGYTRLGIQAQFSTYLSDYNTVSGNYGLALKITFKETSSERVWSSFVYLDSDSFLGDPYNFETYYTQEDVFDISEFKNYPIIGLDLYQYQRDNFKDSAGSYIASSNDEAFSTVLPNIFIKDVMICVGYPAEAFENDSAELYTENPLTYDKEWSDTSIARTEHNTKIIQLRWIHKNTDGTIKVLTNDDKFDTGYEVRWYRYKLGAPSEDGFAGAHWARFYGVGEAANLKDQDWSITEEDDIVTNQLQIKFIPNVNYQTEQIKAIIIEKNGLDNWKKLIETNTVVFTNNTLVSNEATILDANALSIQYDDDEKGHYFLYNEAGNIGKNEDGEVRKLIAYFNEERLQFEEGNTQINWTFPTGSTMIIPMTNATENAVPSNENTFKNVTEVGYTIKKHLDNGATNNTIKLDVIKDGISYHTSIQPVFGTAGDNGSDYKIILTWKNGKNALNLSKDNGRFIDESDYNASTSTSYTNLIGDVVIFDQAGDIVDRPEKATLKANWLVAELGTSSTKIKEIEEANIYYPVFPDKKFALNSSFYEDNENNHNPDISYQLGNYYYFVDEFISSDNSYAEYDIYQKKIVAISDINNAFQQLGAGAEQNNNQIYFTKDIQNGITSYSWFDEAFGSDTTKYYQLVTQLYRLSGEDEKKNKLEFKKVQFTTEPLNQQTGELNSDHGNVEPIDVRQESSRYKKNYYYSTNKKYFIKINDQYILDPWQDYQEAETYYEPIEAKEKVYNTTSGLAVTVAEDNQKITITADTSVGMNSLLILQLTLKDFGDYDLVSYYPIALKDGETKDSNGQMTRVIQYIEGPDRVRYGSSGETDFNKNPYQISTLQFDGQFERYIHGYNSNDNLSGHWQLLFPTGSESSNFDPILKEDKSIDTSDVNYTAFDKPLLSPSSIYIPDARPYGVQFVDSDNICLWTQPILVYQNKYPSGTLNKWNGKDIETDNDAGTITASGFAAGRKERDNTFTGVVIGDWSRSNADTAITKNTGIYGFNKGAMSYAFKDDGTGFIGKDGKGRIYLDGDKSQIFSSNWTNTNNSYGMLLDIDDGYIKMQSPDTNNLTYVEITGSVKDRYFTWTYYRIKTGMTLYKQVDQSNQWAQVTNNTIIRINDWVSQDNLGSNSFQLIDGDGTLSNHILYWFDKIENTFPPNSIKELYKSNTGSNQVSAYDEYDSNSRYYIKENGVKYITLGANQPKTPLSIGTEKNVQSRRFRVDWDGTVHIQDGEFQGNISGSSISGGFIYGGTINGSSIYANHLEADKVTIKYKNSSLGELGLVHGTKKVNGEIEITDNIGIKGESSIVLENEENIRLTTSGDDVLHTIGNIYLQARNEIYISFDYDEHTKEFNSHTSLFDYIKSIIDASYIENIIRNSQTISGLQNSISDLESSISVLDGRITALEPSSQNP